MEYRPDPAAKEELLDRRERLVSALSEPRSGAELRRLLEEVDAALERHGAGTYGLCETCREPIEQDLLRADPLACFCIDHLSRTDRDALERDLALAGRVQRALLPRQDLVEHGWEIHWRFEPAGPVSGDYCDLVLPRRDGDGVLFVVGDVSGKGVAASLLSAHLNALFRTLADAGLGIGEMMGRANRLFCESTLESHYATLVAGRAHPDGTIELANAGQPAPLVVRQGKTEPFGGASVPLGMFCSIEYPAHRLELASGESLLVYTDGVTEAKNRASEDFGMEGVAASVREGKGASATEIAGACLDAVSRFRGGAPRSDDLTLLVLRRIESP
jgi:sigma-B regulation protein RsbU (phosphoserine phosphatase)